MWSKGCFQDMFVAAVIECLVTMIRYCFFRNKVSLALDAGVKTFKG